MRQAVTHRRSWPEGLQSRRFHEMRLKSVDQQGFLDLYKAKSMHQMQLAYARDKFYESEFPLEELQREAVGKGSIYKRRARAILKITRYGDDKIEGLLKEACDYLNPDPAILKYQQIDCLHGRRAANPDDCKRPM